MRFWFQPVFCDYLVTIPLALETVSNDHDNDGAVMPSTFGQR